MISQSQGTISSQSDVSIINELWRLVMYRKDSPVVPQVVLHGEDSLHSPGSRLSTVGLLVVDGD